MNRDEAIEQVNNTTWEGLNPDWVEDGDLTDRFAKSQFDDCPSCGRFEHIRVVNSSGDDTMASVLCCNWQANGDCPSEAIDNWNTRAASVSRKEIVEKLKIALADAIRCPMGVVPDSAEGLLTSDEIRAAENRRIEGHRR